MKRGTVVTIKDEGESYSSYYEMFKTMGFKTPSMLRDTEGLPFGRKFVVFSKKINVPYIGDDLYGIIDKYGNQYLFRRSGLRKVK